MKHFATIVFALSTLLMISSCGPSETEKTDSEKEKTCTYTYDHQSSVMGWTALKFIERTEVPGTFPRIMVKGGGARSKNDAGKCSGNFSSVDELKRGPS